MSQSQDYDTTNHKKLNQFHSEAKRWNPGEKKPGDNQPHEGPKKRGQKTQPAKRKRKGKK